MTRLRRRLLMAGGVALLVLVVAAARWLSRPLMPFAAFVIPAGAEDQVQRFLEPLRLGAPVAGGYSLDDISIEGGVIRLGLANAGRKKKTSVEVHHASDAVGALVVGGVALKPAADAPAEVIEAIRHALDRAAPPKSPWVAAVVGPVQRPPPQVMASGPTITPAPIREPPTPHPERAIDAEAHHAPPAVSPTPTSWLEPVRAMLRRALDARRWADAAPAEAVGVTLILLVIATMVLIAQRLRAGPEARRELLILAVLAAGSVLLRVWLSPRTFLHEYYHIADNWRYFFDPGGEEQYGLAGPVLFRAANRVLGGEERSIFAVNTFLAGLTPPVVVLFADALVKSGRSALLAGVLVALLPDHLRFSGSEELWVSGALLAYGTLAAWATWLRSGDRISLAVSILALALAMQTRPELLPLPLAHLGLVFVLRPRREWRTTLLSRTALLASGTLLLLVSFRLGSLFAHRAMLPHTALPSLRTLGVENTLFDARAMPPVLVVLAAGGVVWGVLRQRAATLWLLALTLAYVIVPLTAFGNRPCIYRTQMFAMTLVAVLAAFAPRLMELLPERRSWVTVAALGVLLCAVLGLWSRREFVTELLDQQQEFAFLDETVPQLPERASLIGYFGPWDAIAPLRNPDWLDELPLFLFSRNHKVVERVSITDLGGAIAWPTPKPGLLYYQGMDCYVTGDPRQNVEPMRKLCLAVHDHYELAPLFVSTLDTRGYSSARYAQGPYDIGFFRVVGLRATPTEPVPPDHRERSAQPPI